ncbi:NUDIX hydrolase [Paenarthrobacter ilicis]|uniref:8-oxo-dGTP pyrophosphatase MutT (NUDIX family) n=1 Tax=Paenarthrobacter ilicis TaxID=43665 RepID=A0ABX0TNI0_9MICC|nr:NUDIX hydrolase [Paenarthrobacter ilicis]MBM7794607.1 8-oxo-dGTP pyrophosphatase MutT (NUDIX family) [Paenarthrobacter ilicis]NIJ02431.1 8-oxo-dGTP pyrophosphatase MutT (NUDIX family) [Paenarthrobacter ilicis]
MTDLADSQPAAAEPRLAASVILLRDANHGLEAFVQHRVNTMDFAPGMVVFPGGRVDPADSSGWDYPADLLKRHAADWQETSLNADPGQADVSAGTVLAAAIREVQEESGLTIEPEDLRPWANWITPVDMPKRFDTFFYVARPLSSHQPQHQTTEAWQSLWMPVAGILEAEATGSLKMMPPTYYLLKEIAGFSSVDAVWSAQHSVAPVLGPPGSLAAFLKERENRE